MTSILFCTLFILDLLIIIEVFYLAFAFSRRSREIARRTTSQCESNLRAVQSTFLEEINWEKSSHLDKFILPVPEETVWRPLRNTRGHRTGAVGHGKRRHFNFSRSHASSCTKWQGSSCLIAGSVTTDICDCKSDQHASSKAALHEWRKT